MSLTIYEQFNQTAQAHIKKPALIYNDISIKYKQLSDFVDNFAYYFIDELKTKPGEKVALLLKNEPEFVIAMLAINKIGALFIPLNNRLTPQEIQYMVNNSAAKAVVFNPDFESKIEGLVDTVKIPSSIIRKLTPKKPSYSFNQEDAAIMFTSGTTGLPKGILHTNENLLFYAQVMIDGLGFKPHMKQLIAAPLYHAIGLQDQIIPAIMLGQTVVLTNDTSPKYMAHLLESNNIDILLAPPTIFTLFLTSGLSKKHKLLNTEIFGYAGAPMRPNIIKKLKSNFPHIRLYNFYGSTEIGGTVTILDDQYSLSHSETVGRAVPGVEVEILNEDSLVTDEIGEVITRPRYLKDNITKDLMDSFYKDYLRVGDLGKLDKNGFLTLFGRMGDMMIVQGENVFPVEIERVLLESGLVKETCVKAKDTLFGQKPVAFVSPAEDQTTDINEKLKDLCKHKLADFKRPSQFIIMESIPKNATGKIDNKKLLEYLK